MTSEVSKGREEDVEEGEEGQVRERGGGRKEKGKRK